MVTEWCIICLPQGLTSLSQVCDQAKCDVSIVEALLKHGAKMDEKRTPPLLTAVRRYALVIWSASSFQIWSVLKIVKLKFIQGILQLVSFGKGCADVTWNQLSRSKVFVYSIFFFLPFLHNLAHVCTSLTQKVHVGKCWTVILKKISRS